MKLNLESKMALITGSTKGICFEIAMQLAMEGAHVIVNGRTMDAVSSAIEHICKAIPSAKFEGFADNLSTVKATEDLLKRFPEMDILINNLGIYESRSFEEITDDEWRRYFEINVLSGIRLSRAYVSRMKKKNWGRIVFISSESAIQTPVEMIHYGMTKTAQLAVSCGLAEYCVGTGITVNSILPGPTHSAGVEEFVKQVSGGQSFEEFEKEFMNNIRPGSLIKRFATPEEVCSIGYLPL